MSIFLQSLLDAWSRGKKIIFQNFLKFFLASALLFCIIWIGYVIRVIGSREICSPITVLLESKGQTQLISYPLVRLSHAGNIVPLKADPQIKNNWTTHDAFVDKFFLVISKTELPAIQSVHITIGDKVFTVSASDLAKWAVSAPEEISSYVVYNQTSQSVLESPPNIRAFNSRLLFFHKVFGNSINWAGDSKLLVAPVVLAVKIFILIVGAALLYFFLLLFVGWNPGLDVAENKKINFLVFVLTLFFTIVALLILNVLIRLFYHPDINAILNQAQQLYFNRLLPSFVPKPVERMQFVLSVLVSPFLLLFFYKAIAAYLSRKGQQAIAKLYKLVAPFSLVFLFSLTFWGLAISNFLYLQNGYLTTHFGRYVYALVLFPVLLWLTFRGENNLTIKRFINVLLPIFVALIILAAFLLNIYSFNNRGLDAYHFNPVFYPMAQLVVGKTLLVGFGSLYGLFPIFLSPLFHLVGFSVLKFTALMALILAGSYLALFVFLKHNVKNKLVLLGGICTLFFYCYGRLAYFQYWPLRFIVPAVLLLLVSCYLKTSRPLYYYLSFAWCCLALLWNAETGVVALFSWLLLLGFDELLAFREGHLIRRSVKHLAVLLGFLLLTIVGFMLYAYFRSGSWPEWVYFFQYQKLFFSGYFMIPMLPPPHVWNLVILAYLSGLLYSLKGLFGRPEDNNRLVFFVSILGIGLFSYYEGRSHDLTLIGPSFTAVLLFTLFADQLLSKAKSQNLPVSETAVLILLLFFLYSAPVSLISTAPETIRQINSQLPVASSSHNDLIIAKNVEFIRQNTKPGEKVFILSQSYDGIYYGESKTVSAPNLPSSSDYFLKSEGQYMVDFLKRNITTKVFVDNQNPVTIEPGITEVLAKEYKLDKTSSGSLSLLVKK